MNLGMFDNIDGLILRERENAFSDYDVYRKKPNNNGNGNANNGSSNANISAFPAQTPLAMAYVPYQSWGEVKSAEDALASGTLFPALDFPFEKGGSLR